MKLISTVLFALLFICAKASNPPDEGMWLPILLGNNQPAMMAQGCRLTSEQIYSINQSSVKDAIVWFGGGCTGEVMSNEGLVFTNHHCGYGSINELRFTKGKENDLLVNGYWAKSKGEELSAPSLSVSFVREMRDVTELVTEKLKGVSEANRAKKLQEIYKSITDEATKENKYDGMVREFFSGNAYYLFLMEKYTDIRLVGYTTMEHWKIWWEKPTTGCGLVIPAISVSGEFTQTKTISRQNILPIMCPYKPKHFFTGKY
jgi:hypothetical protein